MAGVDSKALGPFGLVGFGLACFVLSFALGTVRPLWDANARLHVELAALEQSLEALRAVAEPFQPARHPAAGDDRVPLAGEAAPVLQSIHTLATEEGLGIERVRYAVEHGGGGEELRYVVALPLRASYPAIRRFVDRVLASGAHMSLNSIALRRQSASDPLLEAELHFVVRLASR